MRNYIFFEFSFKNLARIESRNNRILCKVFTFFTELKLSFYDSGIGIDSILRIYDSGKKKRIF